MCLFRGKNIFNWLKLYLTISWLTLKLPDKLQPYGLYVYYVVHICDFGMLRVKDNSRCMLKNEESEFESESN